MPPSIHAYTSNELPAPFAPGGTNWMASRLAEVGYTNAQAYPDYSNAGVYYLRVDEPNVSKNQLAFDVGPIDGALTLDHYTINVPPLTTKNVLVTGPANKAVKVRFEGVGYVQEVSFQLSGGGTYSYKFGASPAGQCVVTPQQYEFYVEDGSTAPVALLATFY